MEHKEAPNNAFLEFLRRNKSNTGMMADLRCALIPARAHRAWQWTGPFFSLEDDVARTIGATVASAFAIQPESGSATDNMGDTLRKIALGDAGTKGLTSFATRFLRLLSSDSPMELAPQLVSIFRTAKQRGIPINHQMLQTDLFYWGDRVKRRWANHYFRAAPKQAAAGAEEEESTHE